MALGGMFKVGWVQWVHNKIPSGVYQTYFKHWVVQSFKYLSLNDRLKTKVRCHLKVSETPPWVSELYQLGSLIVAFLFLYTANAVSGPIAVIIVLLMLYRPFEIFLFLVKWIFSDMPPLHSYRRSLAGFGLNVAEIVLYFSAASITAGCIDSVPVAIYSSLRTVVTIGPVQTCEMSCVHCMTLLSAQIIEAYFLIVVVVASAIGGLSPHQVISNDSDRIANE